LQFVLLKRNKDIVSVFSQIATVLRVNQSIFAYADLKDKRGVTTQVCTAYHLPKERLHEIMKPHKDFKEVPFVIGNPRYVSHKITPNDCQGNQISMVIRAIPSSCSNEEIDSCVNHWVQNGFINYYGLQRFGANSTLYHLIGRAILRNDFKLASMLLLRPQEGEATKLREAREHFRQHKDVAAALRMFPPYLVPEKAILEGLQKNGMEAYEEAFKNVPFHVRRQYVEAYQFYIWNRIASERFTTQYDRTKPVVGDLVYLKAPEHDKEPTKKKQKLFNSTLAPPTSSKTSDSKPQVIALTKENIHDYSIYDVVLPVPGHSCMYPSNALGNLLEKTLYSDGVDFKALATLRAGSNPNDQYNLAGSYRHVVSRPNRVSHTIKKYDDSTIPLFLDDIDRLQGKKQAPQSLSDGSHRALCLQFQLGTSCDASIAIRELLKQSSSVHVQLQLSEKNADNNIKNSVRLERSGNTQSSPDRSNRMKRSRSSISADMKKIKETKVVTKKKMQVAIGRPGFSLGRC
jgi:tRNA pseudouridine13 synthase